MIVLAPIASMFLKSFTAGGRPSLDNYADVLREKRQIGLLVNSLTLGLGTTILCLCIGVPLGILLDRTNLPFRDHLAYLFMAPLIIPPYMSVIAWIHLLGANGVVTTSLTKLLGVGHLGIDIYGFDGSIFVLALSYFPFVTLLTVAGLKSVDRKLEEAAELTHRKWTVLRKITLPLIAPYVFSAAILVFVFAVSDYTVPDLLRVNAYPVEIFVQFSAYYNEAKATALSIPLVLMLIVLIAVQRRYMGKRSYVTVGAASRPRDAVELRRWRPVASGFILVVLGLAVMVPMLDLLVTSGTIQTYGVAFKTAYRQIGMSLLLAACAATIMVFLAFVMSYLGERSGKTLNAGLDFISLLPFAVPAAVCGIGLSTLWNTHATSFIYTTPVIVVFGYVARFIPFVARATASNIKQINLNLEEAVMLTEPSWRRRMWAVVVPLAKPGIVAGWVVVFMLAMGELGATLLLTPPGEATLPIRIYTLLHYGANQLVAALCVILVLVTLLPIMAILAFARKGLGRKSLLRSGGDWAGGSACSR
ncbi:MAG: iron ABC transporter permease [Candidatus Eisenbacteria bacterium]